MEKLPEWISAVASTLTAVGLLLVWWQVKVDHKRSRRERGIEVLREWLTWMSSIDPILLTAGQQFDESQTKQMIQKNPIPLNAGQFQIFSELFDLKIPNDSKSFTLDRKNSIKIRTEVIHFVNMLECALAARRHSVADSTIVKEQFIGFYNKDKGKAIFSGFRAAIGDRMFPAISAFELELRTEASVVGPGEKPTG